MTGVPCYRPFQMIQAQTRNLQKNAAFDQGVHYLHKIAFYAHIWSKIFLWTYPTFCMEYSTLAQVTYMWKVAKPVAADWNLFATFFGTCLSWLLQFITMQGRFVANRIQDLVPLRLIPLPPFSLHTFRPIYPAFRITTVSVLMASSYLRMML